MLLHHLSGSAIGETFTRPLGGEVGVAGLFPVNNGPELLEPVLLAPDTVTSAHPGVLVDRDAEEGEDGLSNVHDARQGSKALAGSSSSIEAGRLGKNLALGWCTRVHEASIAIVGARRGG